jgi:NADH-quinone oxidoreductase subunit M
MPEQIPWLTLLTFSPLIGILVLLFLPRTNSRAIRLTAIATTAIPLVLALWLFAQFDPSAAGNAYLEQVDWISVALNHEAVGGVTSSSYVFQYHLAADGLSLPLIVLAALVSSMAALASVSITKRWKSFYIWFLLLEIGMLGVFLARDLVLFFLFFELTLISLFFLIGIWGYFNREKAANTFLIYNGLGSAIMLLAFVMLIVTAGFGTVTTDAGLGLVYSGGYDTIAANLADPAAFVNMMQEEGLEGTAPFYMSEGMQWTVFILLLVAFGIKLPVLPFHSWMLRVHTEAPPSVVMIHSGVLLKMGAYGMLRFGVFLFPEQAEDAAFVLALLGVANILYGAILAFAQQEFKLVLAYSSISHMGIVLLGIASLNEIGLQGAVFQLVSHGLISALLFLIVGCLYERTGTTELSQLGGLARSMPFMSGILLVGGMASLGLPGLSGFVGEFLSFLGLFESMRWVTAVACIGVILTAVYVLRAVLKITFGGLPESLSGLKDARLIEAVPMIALLAFIVLLGLYPAVLTDSMQHGFDRLLEQLNSRVGG